MVAIGTVSPAAKDTEHSIGASNTNGIYFYMIWYDIPECKNIVYNIL